MAVQERRANAVAVPKQAIQFVAGLVTISLGAFGTVFWNISEQVSVLDNRVKHLEEFGPGTGKRFTADRGERLEDRVDDIEKWRADHTQWGATIVGEWTRRHFDAERRLDKIEENFER